MQLKRNSTEEQAMCIVKVAEEGFYMVPVIDRGYRTVAWERIYITDDRLKLEKRAFWYVNII